MVYLAPQLADVLSLPEYGPITAWADVIHPDDRPQHTRMVAALYRGEIPRLDVEFRYRAQDGTWKWARQHGVVVRGPRRTRAPHGRRDRRDHRDAPARAPVRRRARPRPSRRIATSSRRARSCRLVLDNMTDGVDAVGQGLPLAFSNRRHMETWGYAPGMLYPGVSGHEMIRFQIRRGAFGHDVGDIDATVDEIAERILKPGGNHYTRRIEDGRYIEFNFNRLNDGSLLGIYRDVTELKQREEALATAKETAEAARDAAERARAEATAARNDVERTREIMQTVLDNMSDGVMLFDHDMRWQFTNRQLMEFQRFTPRTPVPAFPPTTSWSSRRAAATSAPIPEIGIKAEVERRIEIMRARRALRAPHRERPVHRVHLQAAR